MSDLGVRDMPPSTAMLITRRLGGFGTNLATLPTHDRNRCNVCGLRRRTRGHIDRNGPERCVGTINVQRNCCFRRHTAIRPAPRHRLGYRPGTSGILLFFLHLLLRPHLYDICGCSAIPIGGSTGGPGKSEALSLSKNRAASITSAFSRILAGGPLGLAGPTLGKIGTIGTRAVPSTGGGT